MSLRRLLNLAYESLLKDVSLTKREEIIMLLNEPLDHELDEEGRARAERKRKAIEIGAYGSQAGLVGAIGMKHK